MERGLAFILIGFPLYLIYKGTLATYMGFASKSGACSGSSSTSTGTSSGSGSGSGINTSSQNLGGTGSVINVPSCIPGAAISQGGCA